jgi:hypothetical protein
VSGQEARKPEQSTRCPGYHNGHASSRSTEGDFCITCRGHKPPFEVRECDCEPTTWGDGPVSHDDACAIHPWCPHEMGALTCSIPCGCRCDGCLSLAESHRRFRPVSEREGDE